jgi:hypothetical protein
VMGYTLTIKAIRWSSHFDSLLAVQVSYGGRDMRLYVVTLLTTAVCGRTRVLSVSVHTCSPVYTQVSLQSRHAHNWDLGPACIK